MAVRDALLALLTIGPAYGFQLHGGLTERTGSRRAVNVGQTYATLERLTKQRLVEPAGTTDDGLPLHRLTTAGEYAAQSWLSGTDAAGADPWDETVDRVLLALSLPHVESGPIIEAERAKWRERATAATDAADAAAASVVPAEVDAPPDESARVDDETRLTDAAAAAQHGLEALASRAEAERAEAVLEWLERATAPGCEALAFAPSSTRPKRGRRPAA